MTITRTYHRHRYRDLGVTLVLVAALLCQVGCVGTRRGPAIAVGSSDSAEQRLLSTITLTLLREHGYRVTDLTALGTDSATRLALETGRISVAWAYTGDTWSVHLGHHQPFTDAQEAFRRVREEDAQNGIVWLGPAPAQRSLAMIVTAELAESGNVRSLDGLVRHRTSVNPFLRVCAPPHLQGSSGLAGLERIYGLRFDPDLVRADTITGCYEALTAGEAECALGYSNDVEVAVHDLRVLTDSRGFFPTSSLAVGVREEVLEAYPELGSTLTTLAEHITAQELRDMRIALRGDGVDERSVARAFLRRNRLLPGLAG